MKAEGQSTPTESDDNDSLCFEEHLQYYRALESNNVEEVTQYLSESSTRETRLNGEFNFGDVSFIPEGELARLCRPLFVAVMMGAVDVMEFLIKQGADVHKENIHGENIIHTIVAASALDLVPEERAVCMYKRLVVLLKFPVLEKLLMHENMDGLRPLEMAANLGCLSLYECIHFTPGVYLVKTVEKGCFREDWIDITEYEGHEQGNRRHYSPMVILSFIDKDVAFQGKHGEITNIQIVKVWMNKKLKALKCIILVWFCFSLLFPITTAVLLAGVPTLPWSSQHVNVSAHDCPESSFCLVLNQVMTMILVAYILLFCSLNVVVMVHSHSKGVTALGNTFEKNLKCKKELVVRHKFFERFDIGMSLVICLAVVLFLLDNPSLRSLINLLTAGACVFTLWLILFFLQTSSVLGHFTIAMQRMMWVLFQFLILYALTFVPFVYGFFKILQDSNNCSNPHFSPSFVEHWYNSFVVSLNMVDFTQFRSDMQVENYFVLLFFHVCYIFVMVILLINFLIALLSTSVAEIMQHKDTIMLIQKMNVCFLIELVTSSLRVWSPVSSYFQKKHFHIVDGRYYLIILSVKKPCSDTTEKRTQ